MKKDITVGAKVGGVFGTGAFENLRVNFDFSVTYKDVESLPMAEFSKDMYAQSIANQTVYQLLYKQMENKWCYCWMKHKQYLMIVWKRCVY